MGEVEGGGHRAAHQRPGAQTRRCLPPIGGDHELRALARLQVRAQMDGLAIVAILTDGEGERRSRMPVPDLRRIHPMPGRDVSGPQQEIDQG